MLQMDINGYNMIFIWIFYKIYRLYGFIWIYMDYIDYRPNMSIYMLQHVMDLKMDPMLVMVILENMDLI